MAQNPVLLRLRENDTSHGVTRTTLKRLATTLGLSETDAIHKALADAARTHLPQYAADNGALSALQVAAVKRVVRKAHGEARVVESLFASESTERPRVEQKLVRTASRAR